MRKNDKPDSVSTAASPSCSSWMSGLSGSWLPPVSSSALAGTDMTRRLRPPPISSICARKPLAAAVPRCPPRLKAAQAELLELKLQRERGEVLDREDVRRVWASIIVANRAMVLGIPYVFHFEEPSLTTHAKGTVDRICRDRLEDMAMQRGFSVLAPAGLCGTCGPPLAYAPPRQENNDENEVGK
jgi:hypothetical protein